MRLLVHECNNEVYQEISPTRNINMENIRPHLYIHGSPSGTVNVEFRDSNDRLIKAGTPQTITSLKTDTYAHGYYNFPLKVHLKKSQTYRVAIVCAGGYSFSESAYVGICVDWDNSKTTRTYTADSDEQKQLDFEIWERTLRMRDLDFSDSFESSSAPTKSTLVNSTSFTIADNQSSAVDVTGLSFDGDDFTHAKIDFEIIRSDGASVNVAASGTIFMVFHNGAWAIDQERSIDDVGVTFSVDNQAGNVGQLQYTSTSIGGTYSGTMKYASQTFAA